ncbi:MAG: carbon-nitrogen hydrolase family protein [Actinomycetota bacterium]
MTRRPPLPVAVAQPLIVPHDVGGNAECHAEVVRAAGARVVVFPELSLTGYELDAEPVGPDDARLTPLVEACAATGAVALAGAPVRGEGGSVHIAMLAFDGDGAAVAYRKMWLGGDETARFTPGPEPAVLEVDGWRLGLAICKDTGVERHALDTATLGIDAYLAGVLEAFDDAHVQPERARRVRRRHGVWVVVASYAGSAGGGFDRAAGGSFVLRPDGSLAAAAGFEVGAVVVAELSP